MQLTPVVMESQEGVIRSAGSWSLCHEYLAIQTRFSQNKTKQKQTVPQGIQESNLTKAELQGPYMSQVRYLE